MASLTEQRSAAREIFDEALRAIDADAAVRRAVRFTKTHFVICDKPIHAEQIYAIAIGKAALSMSHALDKTLGQSLRGGVVSGLKPNLSQIEWLSASRWNSHVGGHPLPNADSLAAAADAVALLQRANAERSLIVFLVSGGGSAMMEWPVSKNISLADLRVANKILVNCGASISEINSVRRAFSAVKGGKLTARAPNCDQVTLIISDVPRGQEDNVASGPTIELNAAGPDAREVIDRYDLRSQLPPAIVEAVEDPRDFPSDSDRLREHFILLSNDDALRAAADAAEQRGFITEIATDISDEPIEEGCEKLMNRLRSLRSQTQPEQPVCLISGGEFTCPVHGNGIGGRNLETALRLALLSGSHKLDFVALCAGTDGIDGNSAAAGAIVNSTTIDRSIAKGLDAQDFLRRSDAYSFFNALGDAIVTAPTGTNVRDVRILLA